MLSTQCVCVCIYFYIVFFLSFLLVVFLYCIFINEYSIFMLNHQSNKPFLRTLFSFIEVKSHFKPNTQTNRKTASDEATITKDTEATNSINFCCSSLVAYILYASALE